VNWVDYVNVSLAIWLGLMPWAFRYRTSIQLDNSAAALALLIIATCGIAHRFRRHVIAAVTLGCGVWILSAPWVLAYADGNPMATLNQVWIGFLVTLFAAVRLRSTRQRRLG